MTGRTQRSAPVTREELRRLKVELDEMSARYGVTNFRVFGSVGRGEADVHSDLDLLVGVLPRRGLLALSACAGEVGAQLHVQIQIATSFGLKPCSRERETAEAVPA